MIQVREPLRKEEKSRALWLLYTYRDRFCNEVKKLPAMDVIEYRIPTIRYHPV